RPCHTNGRAICWPASGPRANRSSTSSTPASRTPSRARPTSSTSSASPNSSLSICNRGQATDTCTNSEYHYLGGVWGGFAAPHPTTKFSYLCSAQQRREERRRGRVDRRAVQPLKIGGQQRGGWCIHGRTLLCSNKRGRRPFGQCPSPGERLRRSCQ